MSEFEYTVNRSILTVKDLTFSYGKGKPNVLSNLSFSIEDIQRPNKGGPEGELIVILGESGSGKSTLLGLLSGILTPQSGEIQIIDGLGSTKMTSVKQGMVGVVDQASTLFEHLTVQKNLAFAASLGGIPKEQQKAAVSEILRDFGLESHGGKYPGQLSGGQRQRVAIARQILRQPSVIIFDEPFSGLDYKSKMQAMRLIHQVSNIHTDQVVMVITHDIYVAVQIADRILFLEQRADGSGAHIAQEFNLMDLGIAWRPNNQLLPEYAQVVNEIQQRSLKRV
ncbi:MAG: ATP-binding cassette domain-containing protein [Bacteroidia bacterium]|nr:ATP-binding cassette domain-containing protein [Bacteroidota bacterium]MBP8073707.1 ATP-binding cassette domain-containing protein [Bacteroidia bacterium]